MSVTRARESGRGGAHHAARAAAEGGGGAQEAQAAAVLATHKLKTADAIWTRLKTSDRHKHVAAIQRRHNCSSSALPVTTQMLRVCEASHRVAAAAGAEEHVAGGTCSLQDRGSSGCELVTVRSIAAASQLHSEMLLSSSFATKTVSGRSGCHTRCLQRWFRCAL